jgi:hypothetical protein
MDGEDGEAGMMGPTGPRGATGATGPAGSGSGGGAMGMPFLGDYSEDVVEPANIPLATDSKLDGSVFTFTTTGNIDNLDFQHARYIRANNATLATIRGLVAGYYDGQVVTIVSIGAGQVNLSHQNTNSTAANRIITNNANTHAYAAGTGTVTLQYDLTTARWRVTAEQTMRFQCFAWMTNPQSLANNTTSAVVYDTESYDIGDLHDTVTNNTRFTIPVGGAGTWLMEFTTQFNTSTNARFVIGTSKNGSFAGDNARYGFDLQATPTAGTIVITGTMFHEFVEGDYVESTAYQNTGGAINIGWGAEYSGHVNLKKIS